MKTLLSYKSKDNCLKLLQEDKKYQRRLHKFSAPVGALRKKCTPEKSGKYPHISLTKANKFQGDWPIGSVM